MLQVTIFRDVSRYRGKVDKSFAIMADDMAEARKRIAWFKDRMNDPAESALPFVRAEIYDRDEWVAACRASGPLVLPKPLEVIT